MMAHSSDSVDEIIEIARLVVYKQGCDDDPRFLVYAIMDLGKALDTYDKNGETNGT